MKSGDVAPLKHTESIMPMTDSLDAQSITSFGQTPTTSKSISSSPPDTCILLNLGCGNKFLKPPFINVDLANNWCERKPDLEADVRYLELPDNYADEIHAYHVFEHFYRYEADEILANWVRILKPQGKLVLELPCLDKILALFDYFYKTGKELDYSLTMWGLFGDPKHHNPAMMHLWCYSEAELTDMMQRNNLQVSAHEPQTHRPVRDMRLEGIKTACIQ